LASRDRPGPLGGDGTTVREGGGREGEEKSSSSYRIMNTKFSEEEGQGLQHLFPSRSSGCRGELIQFKEGRKGRWRGADHSLSGKPGTCPERGKRISAFAPDQVFSSDRMRDRDVVGRKKERRKKWGGEANISFNRRGEEERGWDIEIEYPDRGEKGVSDALVLYL